MARRTVADVRAAIVNALATSLSNVVVQPNPIQSAGNIPGVAYIGIRPAMADHSGRSTRPKNGELQIAVEVWVPMAGSNAAAAHARLCELVLDTGPGSIRRIVETDAGVAAAVQWLDVQAGYTFSSVDSRAGQNIYDGEMQIAVSPADD